MIPTWLSTALARPTFGWLGKKNSTAKNKQQSPTVRYAACTRSTYTLFEMLRKLLFLVLVFVTIQGKDYYYGTKVANENVNETYLGKAFPEFESVAVFLEPLVQVLETGRCKQQVTAFLENLRNSSLWAVQSKTRQFIISLTVACWWHLSSCSVRCQRQTPTRIPHIGSLRPGQLRRVPWNQPQQTSRGQHHGKALLGQVYDFRNDVPRRPDGPFPKFGPFNIQKSNCTLLTVDRYGQMNLPKSWNWLSRTRRRFQVPVRKFGIKNGNFRLGVCVPHECNSVHIENLLRFLYNNITTNRCQIEVEVPENGCMTAGATNAFFGILIRWVHAQTNLIVNDQSEISNTDRYWNLKFQENSVRHVLRSYTHYNPGSHQYYLQIWK